MLCFMLYYFLYIFWSSPIPYTDTGNMVLTLPRDIDTMYRHQLIANTSFISIVASDVIKSLRYLGDLGFIWKSTTR